MMPDAICEQRETVRQLVEDHLKVTTTYYYYY